MLATAARALRSHWGVALSAALILASCSSQEGAAPVFGPEDTARGDLDITFRTPTQAAVPGLQTVQSGASRRFVVYVPSSYTDERAWPVAILLHGSGDRGVTMINALSNAAEEAGVILLAPDANRYTWDLVLGVVGPDADYIEQVLGWAFDHVNVDLSRLTLGGFSDGATYTAWLGLLNGDIFSQLLIMSGCARFPDERVGSPRILILHGNNDQIFGRNTCVPLLLPSLESNGYNVRFIEFEGRHEVSREFARQAMDFVAGTD
jgi:phospholipase/carboxylesterase